MDPTLVLLLLFPVLLWLFVVPPRMKRNKERQAMMTAIRPNSEVVCCGGMLGTVVESGGEFVIVRLTSGQEVKVTKASIGVVLPSGTIEGM